MNVGMKHAARFDISALALRPPPPPPPLSLSLFLPPVLPPVQTFLRLGRINSDLLSTYTVGLHFVLFELFGGWTTCLERFSGLGVG